MTVAEKTREEDKGEERSEGGRLGHVFDRFKTPDEVKLLERIRNNQSSPKETSFSDFRVREKLRKLPDENRLDTIRRVAELYEWSPDANRVVFAMGANEFSEKVRKLYEGTKKLIEKDKVAPEVAFAVVSNKVTVNESLLRDIAYLKKEGVSDRAIANSMSKISTHSLVADVDYLKKEGVGAEYAANVAAELASNGVSEAEWKRLTEAIAESNRRGVPYAKVAEIISKVSRDDVVKEYNERSTEFIKTIEINAENLSSEARMKFDEARELTLELTCQLGIEKAQRIVDLITEVRSERLMRKSAGSSAEGTVAMNILELRDDKFDARTAVRIISVGDNIAREMFEVVRTTVQPQKLAASSKENEMRRVLNVDGGLANEVRGIVGDDTVKKAMENNGKFTEIYEVMTKHGYDWHASGVVNEERVGRILEEDELLRGIIEKVKKQGPYEMGEDEMSRIRNAGDGRAEDTLAIVREYEGGRTSKKYGVNEEEMRGIIKRIYKMDAGRVSLLLDRIQDLGKIADSSSVGVAGVVIRNVRDSEEVTNFMEASKSLNADVIANDAVIRLLIEKNKPLGERVENAERYMNRIRNKRNLDAHASWLGQKAISLIASDDELTNKTLAVLRNYENYGVDEKIMKEIVYYVHNKHPVNVMLWLDDMGYLTEVSKSAASEVTNKAEGSKAELKELYDFTLVNTTAVMMRNIHEGEELDNFKEAYKVIGNSTIFRDRVMQALIEKNVPLTKRIVNAQEVYVEAQV